MEGPISPSASGFRFSDYCRAARYWTTASILNSFLNGSPELPYYEPRSSSIWTLCLWYGCISIFAAAVAATAGHLWPRLSTQKIVLISIALPPAVALSFGVFFAVSLVKLLLRPTAFRITRPMACAILKRALRSKAPAERRRLAEEALALDPENIRLNFFLGRLYENEFKDSRLAVDRYDAAIRVLEYPPPRKVGAVRERKFIEYLIARRKQLSAQP